MKFKREETEYHTKKLLNICKKVLDEIGEYVEACFLVGSLV